MLTRGRREPQVDSAAAKSPPAGVLLRPLKTFSFG